jgi:hypothetical protein
MQSDPSAAGEDIVVIRYRDLSTLMNVVAVAIAREQVSRNDTAVHDAYERAKVILGARPTP